MSTLTHEQAFSFLSMEQLRELVPSAFRKDTNSIATERYTRVDTIEVIEDFAKFGWHPVGGTQMKAKLDCNKGFQKHFIRFRNERLFFGNKNNIEYIPEVTLVNAYNARCKFQMFTGLYKAASGEQFILQSKSKKKEDEDITERFKAYELIHRDGTEKLGEKWRTQKSDMIRFLKDVKTVVGIVEKLKRVELSTIQQRYLAQEFCKARWSYKYNLVQTKEILTPLREEDESSDLFTVYNKLQEKIIKGGWVGNGGKKIKALKNPDREFLVNRRLFEIVEDFYDKLKK